MSDEKKKKASDNKDAERGIHAQAKDATPDSRRKLIKAGMVGLPVILTLKSKPAWGKGIATGTMPSGLSPKP